MRVQCSQYFDPGNVRATFVLENTLQIPARPAGDEGRITSRSVRGASLDGRTAAARRVKVLIAGFVAQLGGAAVVDAAILVACRRAAELAVVAEERRRQALRGEAIDLAELVKIEGAADRATRRLGLDRYQRKPTAGPDLRSYLASKASKAEPETAA